MPKIKDIIQTLAQWAPPYLQESYDNAGLIVGNDQEECTGVLVTLDSIPETIDEAIAQGCNLVVAHHPIVFKGLKQITGKNYVEQTIIKAIKNDVAIYAIHTNLDNVDHGVNARIADILGLNHLSILRQRTGDLLKLVVFVPKTHQAQVMEAMFAAGAGGIGNYQECSFSLSGKGTFRPGEGAEPYTGEVGKRSVEEEERVEVILPRWNKNGVIKALLSAHPYEEVAYDVYALENAYQEVGSGMVGELPEKIPVKAFLEKLMRSFKLDCLKHTPIVKDDIQRVAVCGGAGVSFLNDAIASKADVYITSDVKYHEFFDAVDRLLLIDIGHYESEQFTIELIAEHLSIKFPNFAVLKTGLNTNPVRYYTM